MLEVIILVVTLVKEIAILLVIVYLVSGAQFLIFQVIVKNMVILKVLIILIVDINI